MRRLLFTIKYDGTNYHGWQVQPNGITVQQCVQDALESVTGVRSAVTGCSRTDAGVHANMFCFHTDTDSPIPENKFILALNSHLPGDIVVIDCKEVESDFHARYNCKGKNYIYRIYDGYICDPFLDRYYYHHKGALNAELMNETAKHFVGTHDFNGFCSVGSSVVNTIRTISSCSVKREGKEIIFSVSADGFLYNMVRIIVGTLIDVSDGRISSDDIPSIIESADRDRAGQTAPAIGLFLNEVYY